MTLRVDPAIVRVFGGILFLLIVATAVGAWLSRGQTTPSATVQNLTARIRAWWVMAAVFAAMVWTGERGAILLFALLSFLALREYVTLIPTSRADHRALFWSFFILTPLQYLLIDMHWINFFTVLIPVYAFLFVPTRLALAGDTSRFLDRAAEIQWGLMICVYCLSHAAALLTLTVPGFEGENMKLLLFLVLVVQLSDVLQYVWGKLLGKRRIAPTVSPNKTWEGLLGGVACASIVGALLWWITPFTPLQALGMSLLVTLVGFAGGLTLSAIKRDRGVKDFGTLIEGHGGILDRVDSICFSAPVFFHVTRYYFTP